MRKLPKYECWHCKQNWQGWSKDALGRDCHPFACPKCLNYNSPYMTWLNYKEFKLR